MKKLYKVILGVFFCVFALNVNAQNVGIGTNTPDPSAALEIQGVGQGLLIPRGDTTSITYPATGLLVYQPTDGNFYYYSGSSWERISTSLNDSHDNLGDHSATDLLKMNGNWISNDTDKEGVFVTTAGNVGIGNSTSIVALLPNKLSVAGNMAIGASFVNLSAPPNSLLLEGDLVIGVINKEVDGITLKTSSGTAAVGVSQGVLAGNAALELTTADGSGIQTSRIAIRGSNDLTDITFHTGPSGEEITMMHMEGTTQNIGIGTALPSAKLEVNGDIKGKILEITSIAQIGELIVNEEIIFTKNSYSPLAAGERSVVGHAVVNDAGDIIVNSPIIEKVAAFGNGEYQVIFKTDVFSEIPSVIVSTNDLGLLPFGFIAATKISTTSTLVRTYNGGGVPSNIGFNIIVVGARL